MPSMTFVLSGRDHLSRVLDRAGDASDRLGRRLLTTSINSDAAVRRFTNNTTRNIAGMQRDTKAGEKALEALRGAALLLAPAALPVAASLVPIALGAGTVAVAVGAMTAAIVPQIGVLGEVADAQQKHADAVAKSGARSQEAVAAHENLLRVLAQVPPETRRAAAAYGLLKDSYQEWSDSLAGDTMAPVIKGMGIVNALLPKTTSLVQSASRETDRFFTIVGGEVSSPGFDRLNEKFDNYADRTLRRVNDELVHLLRVQDANDGGKTKEWLDWARAQGPTVADVLQDVGSAVFHVLDGASETGVSFLQLVGVLANLVSAVPPGAIAVFLQLALALKVTQAAALGLAAGRSALVGFAAQLLAMQTAAAGAPTRLRAVGAAIGALSRTAKIAIAGTGIGLLILALSELSQRGQEAPPDVDRLTASLRELGSTGRVTGEVARVFGRDLGGLYDRVRSLTDPSMTDQIQQWLVGWTGWDSTPVKSAKTDIDAIDKALASMVSSGQADLAAAAVQRLSAEYGKGGRDASELTGRLDDYKSALADARFEQQLVADSMGLFGAQAQAVQAQLDAQKRSTDGLRQSIQALNDVQRSGLGGMIAFEASVAAAAKAAKENAGALSMSRGQLDLSTEKSRTAASALQDLASKTDAAAASARESGSSWETVNGIYTRGRDALVASAQAMGLSAAQARVLADQILKIPDKTARVNMATEDATNDLNAFNARLRASPGAKSVTLTTISSTAEAVLKSFGYKVTHLPDGRVTITAGAGQALGAISSVKGAIAGLHDRHITLTTEKRTIYTGKGGRGPNAYASGGTPAAGELAMVGEEGPELVVFGSAARVFDANTTASLLKGTSSAGRSASQGLAVGLGATGGVYTAARTMASAVTAGIRDEMQIASPSKVTKALAADIGKGLIVGLTGSQAKIKSVSADLVKDVKTAFSGRKESSLVAYVNRQTTSLLNAAKARDTIASKIAEAKAYASDLTKNARDGAGLANLGLEPEQVSAGTIKGGLADKLAKIKQFTAYVNILAKKGLGKGLLRQILAMGPEAGYAYASALVGADATTFKAINSLQGQLDSATTTLGQAGADSMYDAGAAAGKGFLKGLEAQQKAIEAQMVRIAKGMDKAIRKALGIKSPSTVMARLGVYSTQGLATGLTQGMPVLDRALGAVAGRVTGIQPVMGRPVATGMGGGTVYQIQVDVHDAMDPVAVGREFQRVLVEFGRVQGSTVQLKVGG